MKRYKFTIIFLFFFCIGTLFPQQINLTGGLISEKNIEETNSKIKKRIRKKFGKKASEQYNQYLIEYSFRWNKKSENEFNNDFLNKLDSLIDNKVQLSEYLEFGGIMNLIVYDDSLQILCTGNYTSLFPVVETTDFANRLRTEIREIKRLDTYIVFNPDVFSGCFHYLILNDSSIVKRNACKYLSDDYLLE